MDKELAKADAKEIMEVIFFYFLLGYSLQMNLHFCRFSSLPKLISSTLSTFFFFEILGGCGQLGD